MTTRFGSRKSRTAVPSRRNSGFDATPIDPAGTPALAHGPLEGGEVSGAVGAGRRLDAEEHELGVSHCVRRPDDEREPAGGEPLGDERG